MYKILFTLFIFSTSMFAQSFHFQEIRYNNALDKSKTLEGNISFVKNGLLIDYTDKKQSLHYINAILEYTKDEKIITLDEKNAQRIKEYFDILILLHDADEKKLEEDFIVEKDAQTLLLTPKTIIKNFIKKIKLTKEKNELKSVQLILNNGDLITINISNEIS